jgi:hypothetical protein
MAKEIHTLMTETMVNVLARQNNLQDGLASARVKAYFAAFETKIAERAARFATENEFQKIRMDQMLPNAATLMNVASRDPVMLVYLSFLYDAFDHWRYSFKQLRQAQSDSLMLQLISVSAFVGSFFSAMNGHSIESLLLLTVGSSLWRTFLNKDWRQFGKLMNTFQGESRKYYLPLDINKNAREILGSFKNCYEILSVR